MKSTIWLMHCETGVDMDEMKLYYARLDKALTEWDLATMRSIIMEDGRRQPAADVLELSMHQVRVEREPIDPNLRLASIEWLRLRGYTRHRGLPLPPPGVLPT